VTVQEKYGMLFRGFIVRAKDIHAIHDVPVPTNQVGAIFQHVPQPLT
jgi:hypothetical protein